MRPIPEFKAGCNRLSSTLKFAKNPLLLLNQGFETSGDTFRLRMFREFIISRDPAFFNHILLQNSRNYKKGRSWDMVRPVLGNGLATSEGDFWLRQRRMIQPAFYRESLERIFETMGQLTSAFLDEMETFRNKPSIDVEAKMLRLTSDITLKTLFGATMPGNRQDIFEQFDQTQRHLIKKVRKPYTVPMMTFNGENTRFERDLTYFKKLVFELIKQRRNSGEPPNDLLQLLLDSRDEETGEQMNDIQIRDEAITIYAASFETSATCLSWLLWEFARNPEIVQKIRKESELFSDVPTFTQLSHMPYTRQVVEEGLRLYPPAWTIIREAIADDKIGGYLLKKGTSVFLSVFDLHRNPILWQDPLTFTPENFSSESVKTREKFNYLPFGAGQRSCIGQHFALMEIQLVIASLVKRFNFEIDHAHQVLMHPQIVLKSANGIKLLVR